MTKWILASRGGRTIASPYEEAPPIFFQNSGRRFVWTKQVATRFATREEAEKFAKDNFLPSFRPEEYEPEEFKI